MISYNLSELFERVTDTVPDRTALVAPGRRLTYRQLDDRANQLAHHLRSIGLAEGNHLGLHLHNGSEYLEGMLAPYKIRAVPVNINYRYVERELADLYAYLDLKAVICHRQFAPTVTAVADQVPGLDHLMVVDDGSGAELDSAFVDYEAALASKDTSRDFAGRSGEDLYCACTGGTTGLPKGVMWRHDDIFFASLGGGDITQLEGPISSPDQIADRVLDDPMVFLITPPLMHVAAHWAAFQALYGGSTVVFPPPGRFDPAVVCGLIESERAQMLIVVGNAMVRPVLDHLEAADPPPDLSSLFAIASGGALLSPAIKERISKLLPTAMVIDGFGSTETGVGGRGAAEGDGEGSGARFAMDDTVAVLDDDLRPVEPGSGTIGRLAKKGRVPLCYYKDPDKTAATFVERDGARWAIPGDLASVETDGTVVIHGRGSVSINTGGEKVFPEEVETVLVSHPSVDDVVVVGMDDEDWGQQVVAVVKPRAGADPSPDELRQHARTGLAGYKVPKTVVFVDDFVRNPNGKPDYAWAKQQASASASKGGV